MVPVDDSAALAQGMKQLLSDDAMRSLLADAGHEYAHQTYASGPLAKRYAEIIRAATR